MILFNETIFFYSELKKFVFLAVNLIWKRLFALYFLTSLGTLPYISKRVKRMVLQKKSR